MPNDAEWRTWLAYWKLAWIERPSARLFVPYRAIPSVLSAAVQFLFFRANRPVKEMWIIIGIILGVYMVAYVVEVGFNTVVRSPAILDNLKTNKIEESDRHRLALESNSVEIGKKLDKCENRLAAHPMIQQEQRQLDLVRSKLHEVTADEKHILRFILDHGKIRLSTIQRELAIYGPKVIDSALFKATQTDLINLEFILAGADRLLYVNPALEPALRIVLGEQPS